MLNWIRCHSVGLFRASFIAGGFGSILVTTVNGNTGIKLLTIGLFVCSCVLVFAWFGRITMACAKKFMTASLLPMNWHELTTSQFIDIGLAARTAFIAQHFSLFALAFSFGWMFFSMLFLIFWSK